MPLSVLAAVLLVQSGPAPAPLVGSVSVASGEVRLERSGAAPSRASRLTRIRLGDKLSVVKPGKITVRLDSTREIWSLPEKGVFVLEAKALKAQTAVKAVFIRRIPNAPKARSGQSKPTMAGSIRGGAFAIAPEGSSPAPVHLTWAKVPGSSGAVVTVYDARNKILQTAKVSSGQSLTLDEKATPLGTWVRVEVLQRGSSPVSASVFVRAMSSEERRVVEAEEADLREALADDPVALGLALGDLWSGFSMVSRLAEAAAMAFPADPASAAGQAGQWLEACGDSFVRAARLEYERAWSLGLRQDELKQAIERLGGRAEIAEWEKLAAERDRLMAEQKWSEAQTAAERVVEILREQKPGTTELAYALDRLAICAYSADDLTTAEQMWSEALVIQEKLAPESLNIARFFRNLAIIAEIRGDLDVAKVRFESSLANWEKIAPGSLNVANTLSILGDIALQQGNLDEAQRYFEVALTIQENLAPESLEMARDLNSLGVIAWKKQDLDTAQLRFESALLIWEKIAPGSLSVGMGLNNLAMVSFERGHLHEAKQKYEAALTIHEMFPTKLADTVNILTNLGIISFRLEDMDEAQRHLEAALGIQEKLAIKSIAYVRIMNNLGNIAWKKGELKEAEMHYMAALMIQEQLNPDSLTSASILNNLGNIAKSKGDLSAALRLHETALIIQEKLAPGSKDVAGSLNNMGLAKGACGDLSGAQQQFEVAFTIYNKLDPNSLEAASCLNNLGVTAWQQGRIQEAQRCFEAALAIQQKLSSGSISVASILNNLGIIARIRGDFVEAKRLYEIAHAIQEKLAPESLDLARTLNNLGNIAIDLGHLDEAKQQHEAAFAIRQKCAPSSMDLASSLNSLGNIAIDLGYLDAAKQQHEAAFAIRQKLAPESLDMAATLDTLRYLAALNSDQGQLSEFSHRHLDQCLRLISVQGLAMSGGLGAFGKEADGALQRIGWLDDPAAMYPYLPALRGAGLTLESRVAASRQRAEGDEEVRQAHSAVQIAAKSESDWASRPQPEGMEERDWTDRLLELRAKKQSAEAALSRLLSARDPRLAVDLKVDAAQVQRSLAEGEMLVEFLRVSSWDRKANKVGEDAYIAYLVGRQGPIRHVRLGDAAEIEEMVESWHELIARANDPHASESTMMETEKELKALGRRLHDRLIKPLGALPETLLIAPDSALHALPFAALVDGRGRYLVESKSLSVVASGRDLVEKPPITEAGDAVVLSAPQFDLDVQTAAARPGYSTRAPNAKGKWDTLEGAGEEGRIIAEALGARLVTGVDATEEQLLALKNPRLLHIATHGFFYPPAFDPSERGEMMSSDTIGRGIRASDSPMIRSGLVLAGANRDEDMLKAGLADGWVTALEISQMDLRGTELVVLSACDTGRGEARGAEGVFGLQRAFRFAGAQSLLMTLFKVPDDSSRTLMTGFYKAWKPGAPEGAKLKALRQAQLDILRNPETRHPRNWAAFTLMGER